MTVRQRDRETGEFVHLLRPHTLGVHGLAGGRRVGRLLDTLQARTAHCLRTVTNYAIYEPPNVLDSHRRHHH